MTGPETLIYLDNGATSHPKPEAVYLAADQALRAGGNPGRGGHRLSLAAGRRVLSAREGVANLFGLSDPSRVIFSASTTDSLNLALKGLLRPGDHVITTTVEHNALRRPLSVLERTGVKVTRLPVSPDGLLDPATVSEAVTTCTRLIAVGHGSNVTGAVQPIADLAEIARRAGALFLVDAAQTAGTCPINVDQLGIHLLATPGHKGLLGPQGTGILCVSPEVPLRPVKEGGTGFMATDEEQPVIFPEGFESGTVNAPGLAGLGQGVAFLKEVTLTAVHDHERSLVKHLVDGLRGIKGVTVYGPKQIEHRCGAVSFNVSELDPGELEERLDEGYGVIGRAGLHCNPGAHALLGTLTSGGCMRLSPGFFNTHEEIEEAVRAVAVIAADV